MAIKKNLPTMVDGVTGTEPGNKNTTDRDKAASAKPQMTSNSMSGVALGVIPGTGVATQSVPVAKNAATTPVTSLTDTEKDYYDDLYSRGAWTQDQQEAVSHGGSAEPGKTNSQGDWYFYDGAERPYYADDADATFMDGSDYYLTTQNKNAWHALNEQKKAAQQQGNTALVAQLQAQQDVLHAANEEIRAKYGYSGGEDGSMFEQIDTGSDYSVVYSGAGAENSTSGNTGTTQPAYVQIQSQSRNELREMLKEWRENAEKQTEGQIDDAVTKAVIELERALEDARPQLKEQIESVDRDAMQALDNSALYAELRGDKGGIGWEQYNSIRNTQAQNHLTVQQAQTKLATETARQIADLRAQGEFQKANASLELAQTYLSQLVSLEKWAAEYSLSEQEFQDSVDRWKAEYELELQDLQIKNSQWQQEFNAAQNKSVAAMGEAMLRAGVVPTAAQLSAMGMTAEQADSYLILRQLELAR